MVARRLWEAKVASSNLAIRTMNDEEKRLAESLRRLEDDLNKKYETNPPRKPPIDSDYSGSQPERNFPLKKAIIGGVLAFVLFITAIVLLFVSSLNRVSANEWGCLYGGGLVESKGLKQTIAPGTSGGLTLADTLSVVPSDDRYFYIDNDPKTADVGANPIIVPAKGTSIDSQGIVNVNVEVQVRFVINENACDLYTTKLKRLQPLNFDTPEGTSPGGWGKFLVAQLNQVFIKASRPLVSPYDYVQLYSNKQIDVDGNKILIYDFMEEEYAKSMMSELKLALGKDYFCGPTYRFDGKVDGVFDNGCPPVEVTVKGVKPVDGQLITNLETTVKNQEQIKVIQSEREKALAQTTADQATQLASIDKERAVETAKAAKDQAVAEAQKQLFLAQNENAQIKALAETAFCAKLTELSVDCAAYFQSINWRPTVILGDGSNTNVNIPIP